ncbi:hypothetical protein [Candidatus Ulvibacter alkanivorans]|uniref:hypothetical protein n=1 Tax=Candidatus Ulvibacter alkanivorans TaxID=2267620 RepID=UPI000DF1474E|nr:hypothetical protein [Candidatus Ulvibacter alkanivorans]
MKHYSYILVIGLILSACTDTEHTGTVISVLEDKTEVDFIARPDPGTIKKGFGLDTEPWRSATFRYRTINSLQHNGHQQLHLEGGNALMGNQLERDVLVGEFLSEIDALLERPEQEETYRFSSIWIPLMEEIAHLQKDSLSHTLLYLYSDLQENNSDWFSVHRRADMELLQNKPEEVMALFLERSAQIDRNWQGLKVVVVYQPQTMEQDRRFGMMRNLYEELFGELGIAIEFESRTN